MHASHWSVTMLHGRQLEVDAERRFGITGDGERIGRLPARFTLLSSALPVAVGVDRRDSRVAYPR